MAAPHIANTRKANTQARYALIRNKFSEIYAQRVDGLKPDYDEVLGRVAQTYGISSRTVKNILKASA